MKPVSGWSDFTDVARRLGVGVLRIGNECAEVVEARIQRWLDPRHEAWLRATLTPEHKALGGIAGYEGSQAGWTPFRQFQRDVLLTLQRHGPMTVAALAKTLHDDKKRWSNYHWPTDALARRALHSYLSKGLIAQVECVDSKRPAKWAAAKP